MRRPEDMTIEVSRVKRGTEVRWCWRIFGCGDAVWGYERNRRKAIEVATKLRDGNLAGYGPSAVKLFQSW